MSRSYRKPYYTVCGGKASEHHDKKIASRCWRRLIKRSLAHAEDWDSYLVPDRREARYNNRCTWPADGSNQLWVFPSNNAIAALLCGDTKGYESLCLEYEKLKRK